MVVQRESPVAPCSSELYRLFVNDAIGPLIVTRDVFKKAQHVDITFEQSTEELIHVLKDTVCSFPLQGWGLGFLVGEEGKASRACSLFALSIDRNVTSTM